MAATVLPFTKAAWPAKPGSPGGRRAWGADVLLHGANVGGRGMITGVAFRALIARAPWMAWGGENGTILSRLISCSPTQRPETIDTRLLYD